MNKTVLITGATGMVGSHVLEELMQDTKVAKIISIGRRKTGIKSDRLQEIVHKDFLDFSSLKDQLKNIDTCFYCLGVYQNQVSKEKFYEITCDYQKALTNILEQTSSNLTFCLFSAVGADTEEKSRMLVSKAKGRAENLLNSTAFPKKYIFRPGYIHPTGTRKPTGLMYRITTPLGAVLFKFFPSMGITDKDLAAAMVKIGLKNQFDSRVFSNSEMKNHLNINL